jgi:hypothetical protein
MELNYETVNDALYNRHPELSGYWVSLGWDDEKAIVTYELEDESEHEVFVYKDGTVEVPDAVIKEMDEITSHYESFRVNLK